MCFVNVFKSQESKCHNSHNDHYMINMGVQRPKVGSNWPLTSPYLRHCRSLLVPFVETMYAIIPSSATFADVGCIIDVVLIEVNWKRIANLNVRHAQISKQSQCHFQGSFGASIPVCEPRELAQKTEQYSIQKFLFYETVTVCKFYRRQDIDFYLWIKYSIAKEKHWNFSWLNI